MGTLFPDKPVIPSVSLVHWWIRFRTRSLLPASHACLIGVSRSQPALFSSNSAPAFVYPRYSNEGYRPSTTDQLRVVSIQFLVVLFL